jgi:hypothetical protein
MTRCREAILLLMACLANRSVTAQVTTLRDMSFGTITSGTTTQVPKTSANAAEWKIHGTSALTGGFQLTLPTTLSGPGATLAISFSTTDGAYRVNVNNPGGGTTFNPHNFVGLGILLSADVYVWLGASLSPPLNQKPGNYTGTVILTTTGIL